MLPQRIYIASPFFNEVQLEIVKKIEEACLRHGHVIYSPRIHSGSHKLTPEEKKSFSAWKPVYESNVAALYWCTLAISVVTYELEEGKKLCVVQRREILREVHVPDAGTCWEIGFLTALGKPVYGFVPEKKLREVNLMLTHSLSDILEGWEELEEFLRDPSRVARGDRTRFEVI